MPMKAVSIVLLLLGVTSTVSAFEWAVCEPSQSKLQTIEEVVLNPDPVPAGSTAAFTIKGSSDVTVLNEEVQLSVRYLGVPVFQKTLSLAQPVHKGNFSSYLSETFPAVTPPGSYSATLESKTVDGELLLCLELNFRVTWSIFSRTENH